MTGYKTVAMNKRKTREEAIQQTKRAISDEKDLAASPSTTLNEYTRADATTIVKKIQSREWTATSVVTAFIRRAIEAHGATNCLTEILFERALTRAKALDDEFQRTGEIRGVFHGVPFTAKDLCKLHVEGVDASIGFTTFTGKPSKESCEIVKFIEAEGGIIITKTNVPQTMLAFECSNPLWGRTLHPLKTPLPAGHKWPAKVPQVERDRRYTSGGSSGGESALLALDGAVLGLGTDIGGSLRIPIAWCGIYAIKPTPGRLSYQGQADPAPGFDAIAVCKGPIARSVEDVRLGCQVLFGKGHCESPIPYNPQIARNMPAKLKFGYYLSDGVIKASPACQRAVIESVKALRAAGHECHLFAPPSVVDAMVIFIGLTAADGYKTILSHLGPDPKDDSLFLTTLGPALPGAIRRFGAWAAKTFLKDQTYSIFLKNAKHRSVKDYLKVCEARDEYVAMWEKEVWEKNQFDGIICPVLASPAFPHHAVKTLSPVAVGTILYNIVISSVGVVPVTRVDPVKDRLTDEWIGTSKVGRKAAKPTTSSPSDPEKVTTVVADLEFPSGPHGSLLIEQDLYEGGPISKQTYDPEKMAGLPVGVQIVGRRFEDEKVLEMMRVLDVALGERTFGPGSSEFYNLGA